LEIPSISSFSKLSSLLGLENDFSVAGARGSRDCLGNDLDLGLWIHLWMQQGVELGRSHSHDRFFLREETLDDHVDSDLDGCDRAPFGIAGLQHEQFATFDRELHVLHVTIVLLEKKRYFNEALVRFGYLGLHCVDVLWRANTGDDVFTLGVHEILAGEALGSSGIVAGETDACCRVVPHVAKNHGLNRHGCTNESTDLFDLAVGDGSVSIP
jgi:hypothetical protein